MAIAEVAEYAHLCVANVEALAVELEAIRFDVEDSRGAKDRAYILRAIALQRCLDVAARLMIGGSRSKTGWAVGTVVMAAAKRRNPRRNRLAVPPPRNGAPRFHPARYTTACPMRLVG